MTDRQYILWQMPKEYQSSSATTRIKALTLLLSIQRTFSLSLLLHRPTFERRGYAAQDAWNSSDRPYESANRHSQHFPVGTSLRCARSTNENLLSVLVRTNSLLIYVRDRSVFPSSDRQHVDRAISGIAKQRSR